MAKSLIYQRTSSGEVGFNMTPLIDCTFQLIIFFILAGQAASQTLARLDLHRPEQSQAIPAEQIETPRKIIVNVVSHDGEKNPNPALLGKARHYEIEGREIKISDTWQLVKLFKARKAAAGSEDFHVEIRADHRVSFGDVRPVMRSAADAKVVNISITALTAVGE